MGVEKWSLKDQAYKYMFVNVITRVTRGILDHITRLKKAVAVFGSPRDVTREG
jgi:hypothetical protein